MSQNNFVFIQLFGMTATLFLCLSYLAKNKKTFLIFCLIGDIIYGLTFIFVNSWGAGIIALLSCGQYIFVLYYDKKQKRLPIKISFAFVLFYIITGFVNFVNIWDIIPVVTYVWFTITLYKNNIKEIRVMCLSANILLIVYDIMVMAYSNAINDTIESMLLFSIIFIDFIKNKNLNGKTISATLSKNFLLYGVRKYNNFSLQSTIAKVKTSDNHNFTNTTAYNSNLILCPTYNYG